MLGAADAAHARLDQVDGRQVGPRHPRAPLRPLVEAEQLRRRRRRDDAPLRQLRLRRGHRGQEPGGPEIAPGGPCRVGMEAGGHPRAERFGGAGQGPHRELVELRRTAYVGRCGVPPAHRRRGTVELAGKRGARSSPGPAAASLRRPRPPRPHRVGRSETRSRERGPLSGSVSSRPRTPRRGPASACCCRTAGRPPPRALPLAEPRGSLASDLHLLRLPACGVDTIPPTTLALWRSTGVAGRGPPASASVGWTASSTTSARRNGLRSPRPGVAAPTAARPTGRCNVTASSRSRVAGATRWTTSRRPADRATPASATTRSPDGCVASGWTSAPSWSATTRSRLLGLTVRGVPDTDTAVEPL